MMKPEWRRDIYPTWQQRLSIFSWMNTKVFSGKKISIVLSFLHSVLSLELDNLTRFLFPQRRVLWVMNTSVILKNKKLTFTCVCIWVDLVWLNVFILLCDFFRIVELNCSLLSIYLFRYIFCIVQCSLIYYVILFNTKLQELLEWSTLNKL